MTFERSRDLRLIKLILTHPKIYRHISDDFSPRREDFDPPVSENVWYVLAWDGEELLGLWTFVQISPIQWEVHTALLPGGLRDRRVEAARELARWIFETTTCRRIVSNVPAYNRAAALFAQAAGMKEYGKNHRSWMRSGKLWDQVEFGLSPEDL